MQTTLADFIRGTPAGDTAESVLRKCVHCGFCLAVCPTYQLLGDERDSPRGRIYLIKEVLEGRAPAASARLHLDRCLTCRACETACPSGVEYHQLLDVGRGVIETRAPRSPLQRAHHALLRAVLPRRRLFAALVGLGRLFGGLLPRSLRRQLGNASPDRAPRSASLPRTPAPGLRRGDRTMLVLAGCVQPSLAPNINAAAARVLARAGITLVEAPGAGCCGALRFHLDAQADGLDDLRRLIDAWGPALESGAEAIVITASGCGAHLREAGRLLAGDPAYAAKAARVAAAVRDVAEVVEAESARLFQARPAAAGVGKVAFQSPCTLQHGQRITGRVERLLEAAGYDLAAVPDAHLCCGSAGTYSILQPQLARELRSRKLAALQAGAPDVIASANIGCLTHLAAGTTTPVRHWIELLDERLD